MASRPLTVRVSFNGEIRWLTCPACGSPDFQPVRVEIRPWNSPLVQGIDLLLGQGETSAAPTDDHVSAVRTTMGCLHCGAGVTLQITGGPGGTGIAGSMDGPGDP
jgi:hypothetical protein